MDKESYYGISEYDTSTIDISTITIASDLIDLGTESTFDWNDITITATLWEDTLPDVDTVKEMCVEYPALEKAYENFKTIYKMVEQDWRGKQDDKNQPT